MSREATLQDQAQPEEAMLLLAYRLLSPAEQRNLRLFAFHLATKAAEQHDNVVPLLKSIP